MIRTEFTHYIHQVRSYGVESNHYVIHRLNEIEGRLPDFFNADAWDERRPLIKTALQMQHQSLKQRTLRPLIPSSQLSFIEDRKAKLQQFITVLNSQGNLQVIRQAFSDLPDDIRDHFYWAIRIYLQTPQDKTLAETFLQSNLLYLREIQDPILHAQGGSLAQQLMYLYEDLHAVEKQRNNVEILSTLSKKMYDSSIKAELDQLIHALPSELQSRMQQDLYKHCPDPKHSPEEIWGKKAIEFSPWILTKYKDPHLEGGDLIQQYAFQYSKDLEKLLEVRNLEEFERMTLFCQSSNKVQQLALKERLSLRTRDWIDSVEKLANKNGSLYADFWHHLYLHRGAQPKVYGTRFQIFAPNALKIELILTAYGKKEHQFQMHRREDGVWELFVNHEKVGRTYYYHIQDSHGNWQDRIDPYCFDVAEQNGRLESIVTDCQAYAWHDHNWMKQRTDSDPLKKPLSIYSLHADSWRKNNGKSLNWRELGRQIVEYNKKFPFTHVQLLGIFEHKNLDSWGFQPDHFLATNHRLGSSDDLKYLIELCHQNNIGVIVTCPYAHFKHEHNGDRTRSLHELDGTNQMAAEPSEWGTLYLDFNKEETRNLIFASAFYLLEIMHVDGLVFDAVNPMTNRNGVKQEAAINFLKEFNHVAREQYPGILTIAEYTGSLPEITQPVKNGGLGFDTKFAIHQQRRLRQFFSTPHEQRHHHIDKLKTNLKEMESPDRWMMAHTHDDAASGSPHNHSAIFGTLPGNDLWRKFADLRLFNAWLFTPASGHAIFMGDEIGQEWSWNNRLYMDEGSVEWHLLNDKAHSSAYLNRGLLQCVGDYHGVYRSRPAFWKLGQGGYIPLFDSGDLIAFLRSDNKDNTIAVIFNHGTMGYEKCKIPLPPKEPHLQFMKGALEIFNSDGIQYGGTGSFRNKFANILRNPQGEPTDFEIALGPLSCVLLEMWWT